MNTRAGPVRGLRQRGARARVQPARAPRGRARPRAAGHALPPGRAGALAAAGPARPLHARRHALLPAARLARPAAGQGDRTTEHDTLYERCGAINPIFLFFFVPNDGLVNANLGLEMK